MAPTSKKSNTYNSINKDYNIHNSKALKIDEWTMEKVSYTADVYCSVVKKRNNVTFEKKYYDVFLNHEKQTDGPSNL